jgi:hypothetical protein
MSDVQTERQEPESDAQATVEAAAAAGARSPSPDVTDAQPAAASVADHKPADDKQAAASSPPAAGAAAAPPAPVNAAEAAKKELASLVPSSAPPSGSSHSRKGANPAEMVIRSFVEALARLARTHRDAVREAGGIAPLVTLLRSGTPEVQALTAAVLRDLATDSPANRDAILKAGGLHELVQMVHKDAGAAAAGEAAGALRSLSNGFPAGCQAIIESRGVDALVKMVSHGEPGSASAVQATGVLANLAQADEANCEVILKMGGVRELVALLNRGHAKGDAAARRLPTDVKQRLDKSAEEASNALWQLAAKAPSCNAAIRKNGAIGPLVETLLRSGLGSSTAQFAAKAVVELVQADEAAKMAALDAIAAVSSKEAFDGHGWSLSFPLLRHLLQGAAERLLGKEEEGISTTGIQYAVDIGRAVELPQKRLDAAREKWEEAQARQKREKLAVQADARRKAKEEEVVKLASQRQIQEAAEMTAAAADALLAEVGGGGGGGGRAKRKEALPRMGDAGRGAPSDRKGGAGAGAARGGAVAAAAAAAAGGGGAGSGGGSAAGGSAQSSARGGVPSGAREGRGRPSKGGQRQPGGSGGRGADSHRGDGGSGRSKSPRSAKKAARNPLGSARAFTDRSGGGRHGHGHGHGDGGEEGGALNLGFIPRAQLLEKIERIAALNKSAPPIPPGEELGEPPIDAIQSWHHRWDQKYHHGIQKGFEQGFGGRGASYNTLNAAARAPPAPAAQAAAQAVDNLLRSSSSLTDLAATDASFRTSQGGPAR